MKSGKYYLMIIFIIFIFNAAVIYADSGFWGIDEYGHFLYKLDKYGGEIFRIYIRDDCNGRYGYGLQVYDDGNISIFIQDSSSESTTCYLLYFNKFGELIKKRISG